MSDDDASRRTRKVLIGLTIILVGCATNNFFLELVISPKRNVNADPGAGPLLTCLQFVAVSFLGAFALMRWPKGQALPSLAPRQVPLMGYLKLVGIFFVMSALNNYAFALHISQPLHMVFRSSSLVAAFGMGYFFFGKNYTLGQLVAVIAVSVGAFCATAAEALVGDTATAAQAAGCCDDDRSAMKIPDLAQGVDSADAEQAGADYMFTWYLGIAMLTSVLLLSALLSQYQDVLYKSYGRNSLEMLFYSHALSLPMFIFVIADLRTHAALWSDSPATSVALAELLSVNSSTLELLLGPLSGVPVMWFYVLMNVLSQYVCLRGVFMVGQAAGALTLTLALTVRKFCSLFLSIWFFDNTFTMYHWLGAALVFAGILVYNLSKPAAKPKAAPASVAGADGTKPKKA